MSQITINICWGVVETMIPPYSYICFLLLLLLHRIAKKKLPTATAGGKRDAFDGLSEFLFLITENVLSWIFADLLVCGLLLLQRDMMEIHLTMMISCNTKNKGVNVSLSSPFRVILLCNTKKIKKI